MRSIRAADKSGAVVAKDGATGSHFVVARKDMGGVVRDSVPRGSRGTVTEVDAFGQPTKASFRVGHKNVEVRVNGREVR